MIPSRHSGVVHTFTAVTGLGLQLVGLYATAATFGGWATAALYTLGAIAMLLQRSFMRRSMP